MDRIVNEMCDMLKHLVNDEELIPTVAKGMRKMHDALVNEGFSSEQAMQIICSQGLGIKQN